MRCARGAAAKGASDDDDDAVAEALGLPLARPSAQPRVSLCPLPQALRCQRRDHGLPLARGMRDARATVATCANATVADEAGASRAAPTRGGLYRPDRRERVARTAPIPAPRHLRTEATTEPKDAQKVPEMDGAKDGARAAARVVPTRAPRDAQVDEVKDALRIARKPAERRAARVARKAAARVARHAPAHRRAKGHRLPRAPLRVSHVAPVPRVAARRASSLAIRPAAMPDVASVPVRAAACPPSRQVQTKICARPRGQPPILTSHRVARPSPPVLALSSRRPPAQRKIRGCDPTKRMRPRMPRLRMRRHRRC